MKKLSKINENIFDGIGKRSKGGKMRKEDIITEEIVRSYLYDLYKDRCKKITIKREGNKQIVDIEGSYFFKKDNDIKLLPFTFGTVTGDFICVGLESLTTLEGCPIEVGGSFSCSGCNSLISLEGCPERVGDEFNCTSCDSLESLKGNQQYAGRFVCSCCKSLKTFDCPQEFSVGGDFASDFCKSLSSLKGSPKKVGGKFSCISCPSLTSLEGAPKETGDFYCSHCGAKFTKEDVKEVSFVKRKISV